MSPCEPRVSVFTERTGTPSSSATKWVNRAVSSTPAWPSTRLRGNPVASCARAVISSSGFDTTTTTAFGAYFARFVGVAVGTYLRGIGAEGARLVGRFAMVAIMVFVVLIALDQLGLGDVVRQTFLILVAAVAFGLALAFGLGGRERAADLLDRWFDGRTGPADDDELPPPL